MKSKKASPRVKTVPRPTGKRYRTVEAMIRGTMPGKKGEKLIRYLANSRRRDLYKAKKLGISLLELYQRDSTT